MNLRIPREFYEFLESFFSCKCEVYNYNYYARKLKFSTTAGIYLVPILSHLSNAAQCYRSLYFQHRLCISALEHAMVLILSRYVLIGCINAVYKHCHA